MKRTTRTLAALMLTGLPAVAAGADPPRHPRARPLGAEQRIAETTLLGGAVEAEVEAAEVAFTTPTFWNGAPQDGLADVHFEVQLRYAATRVLGGRNAGEFVPYQKVHVRIENTTTASEENVLEMDLAPHVGHGEGWHYASNVLLPPGDDEVDPFNDVYRVTVTIELGLPVMLHVDSMPASRLFQEGQPTVVFDGDVVFGGISGLPVGDVTAQLERVQAYADMKAALDAGDLDGALEAFESTLEEPFGDRMDPAGYDASRGLDSHELADLLPNVVDALVQEEVGPDCLVDSEVVSAECEEWIEKGTARFFYLSVLHEIDECLGDVAEGDLDAVDGAAHKWDEAWAYSQALGELVSKRETNCDAGRFGAAIDCAIGEDLARALLDGASALVVSGGVGLDTAIAGVERRLVQIFYLGVVHEIIAMREKVLAADDAGYNKARVEARAFYRTIAHLVGAADDAVLDAAFEDREPDLGRDEAVELVQSVGGALDDVLLPADLADPEVMQ
ncbi:MAG: iron transporter [Deltaproteobacteria bacterium]|nr:iron transporter [Deltaproteobacteria bacterium]